MTIKRLGRNSNLQRICGNATAYINGSGGSSLNPGNGYEYQVFTNPGASTFSVSFRSVYDTNSKVIKTTDSAKVELLVVGGGGGATSAGASAGGGAGGLVYSSSYPVISPTPVQVGAGGPSPSTSTSRGSTGTPSYFGSITGNGGGGGGAIAGPGSTYGPGDPGGSAGGGCGWQDAQFGGSATQPSNPTFGGLVSNYGGNGGNSGNAPYYSSGGGGGSGGSANNVSPNPEGNSTPGGPGRFYPQFGSTLISPTIPSPERPAWSPQVGGSGVYASGGSGGSSGPTYSGQPYPVAAAIGGGGGASASSGQNYTGGGCGGANYPPTSSGPKGGDGIVVVRYATAINHGDGTIQNPIKDGVGLNAITSSGNYYFKTSSMANAVQYYVDTATGDGKWIRIFLANTNNYDTTSFSWDDAQIPNLITNSNKFMYCYVNTSTNATTQPWSWWFYDGTSESNYTSFRDYPPLNHGGTGTPLITRISARQISSMTDYLGYYLRTGVSTFGNACDDSRPSGTWGQICLKGSNTSSATSTGGLSDFPHYTGFSTGGGDYCQSSNEGYNTTSCSDTRRFAVYVQL